MQFVKSFKTMIPEQIQLMIVGVVAALFVVFQVTGTSRILPLMGMLIATLSVAFIVVYLAYKKAFLLSYVIIFILGFSHGLRRLFNTLTSFWMDNFAFYGTFDAELILGFVVFVYLACMIVSYAISETFIFKMPTIQSPLLMLLFLGFLYLNHGFVTVIIAGLILLILLNQSFALLPIMFMTYYVVSLPFQAIDRIIQGVAKFTSLNYWFMVIFAVVVLVYLVLTTLEFFKHSKKKIEA